MNVLERNRYRGSLAPSFTEESIPKRFALYFILFSYIFLLSPEGGVGGGVVFSQTQKKKDLEAAKLQLAKEIEYKNQLLHDVKISKNRSMVQLAILNSKIASQQKLISTINAELNMLEGNISETKAGIVQKETELEILKKEYARILVASYMNRDSYARLMFLFAADDFNQAIQRIKYMEYYSDARKKQAGLIVDAQRQLQTTKQELEDRKEQQSKTLTEKQVETGKLSEQKRDKEETLTDLQKREKDIRAEIKAKKEQAENLRKAIEKIADIVRPKTKDASGTVVRIALTPEEKTLSGDFEGNQGKLPWPLIEGDITERFGKHQYENLVGTEINNNGIDITTNKGADVRSVFNGKVVAVTSVGGLEGKVIIVKHGDYMSVYSNIEEAYVKSGDNVKTKQSLGKVLTKDSGETTLHLEIWKGGQLMLNPENWIVKRN